VDLQESVLALIPASVVNRRIGTLAIPWLGDWTAWLDKRCAVLNPAFGP
jgi:hypothetical protein